MKRRPGHWWCWGATVDGKLTTRVLACVHSAHGRGPFERVETSKKLSLSIETCGTCGLLHATGEAVEAGTGRAFPVSAYGFAVDALALMGSAPPCDPVALSRPPHALAPMEAA